MAPPATRRRLLMWMRRAADERCTPATDCAESPYAIVTAVA